MLQLSVITKHGTSTTATTTTAINIQISVLCSASVTDKSLLRTVNASDDFSF